MLAIPIFPFLKLGVDLLVILAEIQTIEAAQQFLATVISTDEQFEQQPSGSVSEILEFTLQTEICSTAKLGCYLVNTIAS